MVIETGLVRDGADGYAVDGPLAPSAIPTTLHDSLTARLDRLAPVKEVAQLGAAIGREFSFELLAAVSPMDEPELRDALAELVDAEIIFPHGVGASARFVFKHALIRDAAYQSLLKSSSQQYHRRIATALEERFPEVTRAQPELVAHHYAEAGLTDRAVDHWRKAGDRARERSAMTEAQRHFERGLDLLPKLPDGIERDEIELSLTMGLGTTLMATEGYTSPTVASMCERSRELATALDRPLELGSVMLGSAVAAMLRGDLLEAHGYGVELLSIAARADLNTIHAAAHFVLGITTANFGRLREADEHLDTCIELLEAEPPESVIFAYGQHPRVVALSYRSMVAAYMGRLDYATRARNQARDYARVLAHPFTTALALGIAAQLALIFDSPENAQELCDELLAITEEHDFPFWRAHGLMAKGRLMVEQGAVQEGLTLLRESGANLELEGVSSDGSLHLVEAYLVAGEIDAGLDIVRGVRAYIAEIHRDVPDAPTGMAAPHAAILEGRLLAANAEYAEAETCFNDAIELAQPQGSLFCELLAVMGIARVRQSQGSHEEGRAALQTVYDRFTEGFDTPPLVEARALLEELSA